jgi:hypothetical protein
MNQEVLPKIREDRENSHPEEGDGRKTTKETN